MLVREWMTAVPVTIHPPTTLLDAFLLLRELKIHRLPVVDQDGAFVGIVTEHDFLYAALSPASTLNMFEWNNLPTCLPVSQIMTCPVNVVSIGLLDCLRFMKGKMRMNASAWENKTIYCTLLVMVKAVSAFLGLLHKWRALDARSLPP